MPSDAEPQPLGAAETVPVPLGGHSELPTLRKGDHGTAVCLLQRLLVLSSEAPDPAARVEVDGDFGEETESCLLLHQHRMALLLRTRGIRLPADGVCGPATWSTFWQPWLWSLSRGEEGEVRH